MFESELPVVSTVHHERRDDKQRGSQLQGAVVPEMLLGRKGHLHRIIVRAQAKSVENCIVFTSWKGQRTSRDVAPSFGGRKRASFGDGTPVFALTQLFCLALAHLHVQRLGSWWQPCKLIMCML